MARGRDLVIVGDSSFAQVAYEYFTHQSDYRVAAFAVEPDYMVRDELFGLPVVALPDLPAAFPPSEHDAFAALAYTQLNRLRTRLMRAVADMGYELASFVSPHARVAASASLGRHCFVFEDNVIQPFVTLGENVVLWSGNHIGHHSSIANNCFVSSHVVVAGHCEIGENCFLGVNSTIANNLSVAPDCWIGPAVVISGNTEKGQLFPAAKAVPAKANTYRFFKVEA